MQQSLIGKVIKGGRNIALPPPQLTQKKNGKIICATCTTVLLKQMAAEFATKATLQSQYLNCFARGKKEKRDNPSKSAASAVFFSLCFPRPPITFTQHKKGGGKRNGYSLREMAVRAFRLKSLLLLCRSLPLPLSPFFPRQPSNLSPSSLV